MRNKNNTRRNKGLGVGLLFLVGLGLCEGDISVRAIEIAKKADKLFLDPYTNRISSNYINYLEKILGKNIAKLSRSDLEENAKATVEYAKNTTVVIFVMGDPLIATTHHTIIDIAHKMGIAVKVIHAPSIFTAAIGESGLDIYRFGPTTTIPFWSNKYKPISFIDVISKNLQNNQHTLVLLDYNYKEDRAMSLGEAIDLLNKAQEERKINIIQNILVLADVGKENEEIVYADINTLTKISERFKGKLISLIIPSNPNFAEAESLSKYAISSI
jgi:diphthine synthase